MTLCIAWRSPETVHFASDSRITVARNSTVDIAIKVLSIPYRVLKPSFGANPPPNREVAWTGDFGMCFAGSAINSIFVKETLVEILRDVQYAPGFTDMSMLGLINYIFIVYRSISKEVCATALGPKGRAEIIIGGYCTETSRIRVFSLSTDKSNTSHCNEILKATGERYLIGSGAPAAARHLLPNSTEVDYLSALKCIASDPTIPSVGGAIQYGCFEGRSFRIFGIAELGKRVHYWRGGIDFNSDDLMADGNFVPAITCIDPFKSFA